jgi:hypothetical protein
MFTYFIVFKPKGEKKYRLYTNQIFTQVKEADEFATKSLGKKGDFKIVNIIQKHLMNIGLSYRDN